MQNLLDSAYLNFGGAHHHSSLTAHSKMGKGGVFKGKGEGLELKEKQLINKAL
jgi:hypothetical protein